MISKKALTKIVFCVIIYAVAVLPLFGVKAYAAMPSGKRIIVIDAGHGDWDPGKEQRGTREKDINLKIAEKLQMLLEVGGAVVFITRSDDTALSDNKREDLRARAQLANKAGADIFVSIHQNSYPDADVRGAQAFYMEGSEKSKDLAEAIQARVSEFLDTNNKRQAKANDAYYVLKTTDMPAVIVECGFMSSPDEIRLLLDESYQDRVAWAVYLGISDYFLND